MELAFSILAVALAISTLTPVESAPRSQLVRGHGGLELRDGSINLVTLNNKDLQYFPTN